MAWECAAEIVRIHSKLHPAELGSGGANVGLQLHGMGGVGKTELVAAYANKFADAYSGGILWLSLEGYEPRPPITLDEAQFAWLRALHEAYAEDPSRLRRLAYDENRKRPSPLPPASVHERLMREFGTEQPYLIGESGHWPTSRHFQTQGRS